MLQVFQQEQLVAAEVPRARKLWLAEWLEEDERQRQRVLMGELRSHVQAAAQRQEGVQERRLLVGARLELEGAPLEVQDEQQAQQRCWAASPQRQADALGRQEVAVTGLLRRSVAGLEGAQVHRASRGPRQRPRRARGAQLRVLVWPARPCSRRFALPCESTR